MLKTREATTMIGSNPLGIKQLSYFLTVSNCESIADAAREIGITQPALTRSIQHLEDFLGLQLFHRTSAGIELTNAGERLFELGSGYMSSFVDVLSDIRARARKSQHSIIVGTDIDVFTTAIEKVAGQMEILDPPVEVFHQEIDPEEALSDLEAGRIDILLQSKTNDTQFPPPSLQSTTMACNEAYVVLRNDDPLAGGDTVPVEALTDRWLIAFSESRQPGLVDDLAARLAIPPSESNIVYYAESLHGILNCVEGGLGVGIVGGYLSEQKDSPISIRPLAGFEMSIPSTFSILWRSDRGNDALNETRAALLEHFNERA